MSQHGAADGPHNRAVTTEGAAIDAGVMADDGPMFCYRHPDRETYVRCGRCDRPICTRCAMQGPVGFRCKQCGTLANDPLSTFTPRQIVLGFGVAAGGGLILGIVAGYVGWFSILISFFGGGIIAEAVNRTIGIKRGARVLALVIGGLIAGALVGDVISFSMFASQLYGIPADVAAELPPVTLADYLYGNLPWLVLSVGAASFGAYTRLR